MDRPSLLCLYDMQVSFLPIVKGISSPGTADHQAEVFEKAANMVLEGGDTGNATVFFFGGTTPPRFRWVASRRGYYASCMRHYGAGPCSGPDRM